MFFYIALFTGLATVVLFACDLNSKAGPLIMVFIPAAATILVFAPMLIIDCYAILDPLYVGQEAIKTGY